MSHSSPTASHLPTTSSPMTGPLAVEVVATLGDSVVGVRHVSRPDSGRLRPLTKALLLGGAALLATGAIGFATATRIAHDNEVRRHAWTAAHKPAYGFRPTLVSPAHDALTFFGLGLGLTAIATGLVRRRRELQPSTIRVGSAASTDFALAETVDHALVRPEGDHFVVDLGPLRVDGGAAPAGTVVVVPGLRLTAHAGLTQFHIAAVEAPREHAVPVLRRRRPPRPRLPGRVGGGAPGDVRHRPRRAARRRQRRGRPRQHRAGRGLPGQHHAGDPAAAAARAGRR